MSYDYEMDSLREELDSALRHLADALLQQRPSNDIAWWLCANHARWLSANKERRGALAKMAAAAGTPPKGKNWDSWFTRVRH